MDTVCMETIVWGARRSAQIGLLGHHLAARCHGHGMHGNYLSGPHEGRPRLVHLVIILRHGTIQTLSNRHVALIDTSSGTV
jgi:hypothetical protein